MCRSLASVHQSEASQTIFAEKSTNMYEMLKYVSYMCIVGVLSIADVSCALRRKYIV